ncbi:predicted protein [Chaetoceros tenuissimus]|uniref:F-box domain-containing protein n=1 Tax=Chaetoceros tenuissimus TaxID=426638 RepID=A0AAD3D9I5_9STRA|nr:predicted protein [Chaetoceros tenuissimus]
MEKAGKRKLHHISSSNDGRKNKLLVEHDSNIHLCQPSTAILNGTTSTEIQICQMGSKCSSSSTLASAIVEDNDGVVENELASIRRNTTLTDLCSDTLVHIIQFCLGNDLEYIIQSQDFQNLTLTSKFFHEAIYNFARSTPLKVPGHLKSHQISFLCQKRMKIGEFKFYTLSPLDMFVFLHIMNTCDISDLKRLSLKTYVHDDIQSQNGGNSILDARTIGVNEEDINKKQMSSIEFQKQVAAVISRSSKCFHSLELEFQTGDLYSPLLSNFANSLQYLLLYSANEEPVDDEDTHIAEMARSLSSMEKLKTLVMICCRNIDTLNVPNVEHLKLHCYTTTKHINCPKLKTLEINLIPEKCGTDVLKECPSYAKIEDLIICIVDDESIVRSSNCEEFFQELSSAISAMPSLKKLTLRTKLQSTLKVKSLSLVDLDITEASFVRIAELKCPSLSNVLVECSVLPDQVHNATSNILPCYQFNDQEFAPMLHSESLKALNSIVIYTGNRQSSLLQVPPLSKVTVQGINVPIL